MINTWQDTITSIYDKNRTQMNGWMDELEEAVHEFSQARLKMN